MLRKPLLYKVLIISLFNPAWFWPNHSRICWYQPANQHWTGRWINNRSGDRSNDSIRHLCRDISRCHLQKYKQR